MEEEFAIEFCVCGYHVYKDIWEAAIGEELPCEQEPRNTKDRYAGAASKYLHSGLVTPCNMCTVMLWC